MIVVTGATGHYGRRVVEGLLTRLPASEIGVSVRDPEKAADFAAQGVRVKKASFAEPASSGPRFRRRGAGAPRLCKRSGR